MPIQQPHAIPLPHRRARLVLGGLLAFSVACAHALDPGVKLADYNHTIWTAKDGAPGAITVMAQTRDGWLWLGTNAGLYRFDGMRFSKFVPPAGSRMLAAGISTLYASDDGALVIGYLTGGVTELRDGKVRHLAMPAEVSSGYRAQVDIDGTLWMATQHGLQHYRDKRWTRVGDELGFPGTTADLVALDRYGRLWASSQDHDLFLFDRASGRFAAAGMKGGADALVSAPDGRVWAGHGGSWRTLPLPSAAMAPAPAAWNYRSDSAYGLFDRDGNHWAYRCPAGVCRIAAPGLAHLARFDSERRADERLDQPWQLGSLTPNGIFEDREGNIWIATPVSLERFRHNAMNPIPLPAGDNEFQVVADEHGQALVSSMQKGFVFQAGATQFARQEPRTVVATNLDGSLMRATLRGVERIEPGKRTLIPYPTDAQGKPVGGYPLRLNANGDEIWLGIANRGMYHFVGGKWIAPGRYGLRPGLTAITMGSDGTTWFGFKNGSVLRLRGDKLATVIPDTAKPLGAIMLIDVEHGVLVAGEEGLAIVDGTSVRKLASDTPENLAGITGYVRSADGDRWFNGRKGVVRVRAAAWDRAVADPAQLLAATVYDSLDGYPGSARSYVTFPTATRTADDKLWFVAAGGVVVLDPARLHRNGVAPPLAIDPIAGAVPGADGVPALPPGTTSLRIDYTALAYTKPERIRFRYRLEGVDDGWQEAGARRTAFYTRLGPGTYRFRVAAANEDGVASSRDAVSDFVIRPTLAQTGWFRLLLALAGACLLALAYRWRTRRLAQRLNERFQERLDERERIARALHDTLLQNMQALILRLHAAVQPLERGGAARTRIEAILDQADSVMGEARAELKGLRQSGEHGSEHGGADIGPALAAFGQSLQDQFGPRFRLVVGGTARELQAMAWQELYYIGREALFNAYQHACAGTIEAEITYGANELGLVVRDDGAGIDPAVQRHGGREGHWGLAGMKERARALDGTLEWWSRAGRGTEVIARFPAPRVYVRPTRQGLRQRLLALLGRRA